MPDPEFPVSENFRVLGGYHIYRSDKLIVAIVAVESSFGKDIRLYRWQKRGTKDSNPAWKVDLARMSVARWDWDKIVQNVAALKQKFGIGRSREDGRGDG